MTVHLEMRGRVALVTLDRPERRNAVDHETLVALRQAQVDAHAAGARCLVLTGAPPAFCAGADLTGVEAGEFANVLSAALVGLTDLPIPTIASVDGPALGAGSQLVVACDLRVATERSVFGIPAAKLGLVVDHWTVSRLTQELGPAIARAMLLAAETYTTAQLLTAGAIHRIGSLAQALEWAAELVELAPLTIAAHKVGLEQGAGVDFERARAAAWASADAEEGRAAFLAKRRPHFTGT